MQLKDACWKISYDFLSLADFFSFFFFNSFRNIIRMSNSLNLDQAGQNVRPDLGTNYLQKLSADSNDGTGR